MPRHTSTSATDDTEATDAAAPTSLATIGAAYTGDSTSVDTAPPTDADSVATTIARTLGGSTTASEASATLAAPVTAGFVGDGTPVETAAAAGTVTLAGTAAPQATFAGSSSSGSSNPTGTAAAKHTHQRIIIIAAAATVGFLLICLVVGLFYVRRKRKSSRESFALRTKGLRDAMSPPEPPPVIGSSGSAYTISNPRPTTGFALPQSSSQEYLSANAGAAISWRDRVKNGANALSALSRAPSTYVGGDRPDSVASWQQNYPRYDNYARGGPSPSPRLPANRYPPPAASSAYNNSAPSHGPGDALLGTPGSGSPPSYRSPSSIQQARFNAVSEKPEKLLTPTKNDPKGRESRYSVMSRYSQTSDGGNEVGYAQGSPSLQRTGDALGVRQVPTVGKAPSLYMPGGRYSRRYA